MKALLVIDMQQGSFREDTPRYATSEVVENINKLSELFRNQDYPVLFIQHDGSAEGNFLPGTEEWKLLPELIQQEGDLYISKEANDAFYGSDLKDRLEMANVEELFITGCATDFCVDSTLKSALIRGYKIHLIRDGHTTGERPNLSAKEVIDYYHWIWENMLPTPSKIKLITTEDCYNTLKN